MTDFKLLKSNFEKVQKKIKELSNESGQAVTLIAVSKTKSVEEVEHLYQLGQRDFGENYVQELAQKAEELESRGNHGIRWHFIGHLQKNKVNKLLPYVDSIHTVDSLNLAKTLNSKSKKIISIFIQVNIDREESKAGVFIEDLTNFIKEVKKFENLKIQGFMIIPSADHLSQSPNAFKRMKDIEAKYHDQTQGMISMGMSEDYEVAILEGATHVRVGSAIFGLRS